MEERIRRLELEQQKLQSIAWVLGTLAVVFGFTGAFGINMFLKAKNEINNLQLAINDLNEKSNTIEAQFESIRLEKEEVFNAYVEEKKREFDDYSRQELSEQLIVDEQIIEGIKLRGNPFAPD